VIKQSNADTRMMVYALLVGVALMGAKFLAWWLTNSNAILTDALESIVNVVAGAFASYSLWLASRPADYNHPYGHGKIEFISAGVEGVLIGFAGLSIFAKSIYNLIYPQALGALDLGMVITAACGGVNYLMGWWIQKRGQATHSLTMVASGQHLKSDAWSSAGLLAGLAAIYATGIPALDNLVALGFGVFILVVGSRLVRRSVAGIMDEADDQLIADVVARLAQGRSENWIDVHNLRLIQYGAELHLDCHLSLPWYFTTRQSHAEVKAFEDLIRDTSAQSVELFIHVDPCEPPESCRICAKADCPVREAALAGAISWTVQNVKENKKHEFEG
jgi:cation diffusion facilitator family transporter